VSCAAGEEEDLLLDSRGGNQLWIIQEKDHSLDLLFKDHPLKDHHPGNIQGKDRKEDKESPTEGSSRNEHSALEIILLSLGGDSPERKKDTINKGKERIPVCKEVILRDIEEAKEDKIPLFEVKDHTMMKEGKIRMVEERLGRTPIQETTRDIDKGWTEKQGSQVIGNLEEITAQTAVGRC
jgi:hypothetical protein